jgi:hypothetical protein
MTMAGWLSIVLLSACEPALATFHLWQITKVYSNASGTVQFVEMFTTSSGQEFVSGHMINSNAHQFTVPTDLPATASHTTANQHLLFATPGYFALRGVPPADYNLGVNNFFNINGDSLNWAGVNTFAFSSGQVPTDGAHEAERAFNSTAITIGINSPTNFAGVTGTIPLPPSDFNMDGYSDVIWQDPVTGMAQVWFLGGAQGTSTIGAVNLTASNTWRIVGVGDFNRDGRPDVVWQDPVTGAAQVWFLGGAQGNVVTGAANLSTGNSWRIMSIADFNGDGQPDIIWQDPVTGLAQIWLMGGAQGTILTGAVNLTASNSWRIVGTGDFNQDGHPDVVWQDPVSGTVQIWYLGGAQGNVVTIAVNLTGSNIWGIAAVADFNLDGHPDVVFQDPVSGASQVWFLGGTQGTTITGTAALSGSNLWRIAGPR